MGLLELLKAVQDVVGHDNVRWDVKEGEIRLWTGLTMRNEDGTVNADGLLRQTAATVALEKMGD